MFLSVLLFACGGPAEPGKVPELPQTASLSPTARPKVVEELRLDLQSKRHPADGQGKAWITTPIEPIPAGDYARLELIYEAGELGVAQGGMVYLQSSPFWGWSQAQGLREDYPGYTTVSTQALGVELEPDTFADGLFAVKIKGRKLVSGEQLHFVYGAGPSGAQVDRYAERRSRIWVAVDGDGDGVRSIIANSPAIDVAAGPAATALAVLPSTAKPKTQVRLNLSLLDANANLAVPTEVVLSLEAIGKNVEVPQEVVFTIADGSTKEIALNVPAEGFFQVSVHGPDGPIALSNALLVSPDAPRVLWADLHGHSQLSDGTATPREYYAYARNVAGLDVAALTDHDHWGMEPLSKNPALWSEIREAAIGFHQPERFVTLLGYEWTNWLHGHRHVLYFTDEGEVFSSVDPRYETPPQLWEALRGQSALTIAHHSAGGPVATNWDYPPDPEFEPVTEVASVHGSSEAADSPRPIYQPVEGNWVRDQLDRGYRLGLIGSGDTHDGHPGMGHLVSGTGGVAAILSEELTREAVLEALRARRVYATNGPRILVRTSLAGRRMGSSMDAPGEAALIAAIMGTGPISHVDLIRNGSLAERVDCQQQLTCFVERQLSGLDKGYLYLRVVQVDGGAAWSSPFFFD
ncbi:MAG: CehA/McbA family metallohydrolase [Proteobacteria bacterium]|nr:CehA/McbA family metallohydrolase [Pseudomonadota bacterium]